MAYDLRRVSNESEWEAYHEIRERVLWESRGLFGYDRSHPDEHVEGNHPFLLLLGDEAVGVVRVDIRRPVAWLRRVAIREDLQRRGHGRVMLELAMDFARKCGCDEVRSNVDAESVAFYRRLAFDVLEGDDAGSSVAMIRSL